MAIDSEIQINQQDLKRLLNELEKMPDKVEKRLARNAAMAAMRVAAKEIKKAAPKGSKKVEKGNMRYGTLRKNIKARRVKSKKGFAGAKVTTGDAYWGYILEKGSRFIAPQPWFDPAFERSKGQVTKKLKESLTKSLEREWKKLK